MKKRILTGLVLAAIFIPILFLGGIVCDLVILSIGIISMKEFLDVRDNKNQLPLAMKIISFAAFIYFVFNFSSSAGVLTRLNS